MQSLPEIHKTIVFLWKNGGTVEGPFLWFWPNLPLLGSKIASVQPLGAQKVMVKPNEF